MEKKGGLSAGIVEGLSVGVGLLLTVLVVAAMSCNRFPLDDLDLTPFLSSSVLRNRYGMRMGGRSTKSNSTGCDSNGEEDADGRPPALYRLYAVVCHHGQMEGGHYVAYIRQALAMRCEGGSHPKVKGAVC